MHVSRNSLQFENGCSKSQMELDLGESGALLTHLWGTFDAIIVNILSGLFADRRMCLKIVMMEHMCNVSVTISTAAIKWRVQVHGRLVFGV